MCFDGDVRLVNGSQPYRGRVEVCLNEVWGTICADISRSRWDWSLVEANVVCRQLGYPGACENSLYIFDNSININYCEPLIDNSSYNFGSGSVPINLNYVHCTGTESTILDCPYSSASSYCASYKGIIGVECRSGINTIPIVPIDLL